MKTLKCIALNIESGETRAFLAMLMCINTKYMHIN